MENTPFESLKELAQNNHFNLLSEEYRSRREEAYRKYAIAELDRVSSELSHLRILNKTTNDSNKRIRSEIGEAEGIVTFYASKEKVLENFAERGRDYYHTPSKDTIDNDAAYNKQAHKEVKRKLLELAKLRVENILCDNETGRLKSIRHTIANKK